MFQAPLSMVSQGGQGGVSVKPFTVTEFKGGHHTTPHAPAQMPTSHLPRHNHFFTPSPPNHQRSQFIFSITRTPLAHKLFFHAFNHSPSTLSKFSITHIANHPYHQTFFTLAPPNHQRCKNPQSLSSQTFLTIKHFLQSRRRVIYAVKILNQYNLKPTTPLTI